jgi:hypothetical protein
VRERVLAQISATSRAPILTTRRQLAATPSVPPVTSIEPPATPTAAFCIPAHGRLLKKAAVRPPVYFAVRRALVP